MKPLSCATVILLCGLFVATAAGPAVADSHDEEAQTSSSKLDLNKATQLDIARDINPLLGKDVCHVITRDRAARGPYKSLDDLARIKKITKEDVKKLRDAVCVDC